MRDALQKLTVRQWVLLGLLVPVSIVFVNKVFFGGDSDALWPGDGVISGARAELKASETALREARERAEQGESELRILRSQASPFWKLPRKGVEQAVISEFEKLAQRAQIQNRKVDRATVSKLLNLGQIYQVDFYVQVSASMREVTRLLKEVEHSERAFFWSQCTIRPDNLRNPNSVRLTGRVQVLVLSDDASAMLEEAGGRS